MLTLGGSAVLVAAAAYANAHLRLFSDASESYRLRLGEVNLNRALAIQTSPCFELFKQNALKQSTETAIWTRERSYTWGETYQMVCRYAHFFRAQGVGSSDVVAFYLINSAELMFAWMALLSIGAYPAMINYNLEKLALARCIRLAAPKLVLVDNCTECQTRALTVTEEMSKEGIRMIILDTILRLQIDQSPAEESLRPSRACLSLAIMYTSGSTDLPKAMEVGIQRAYCTASVDFKTFRQRPGAQGDRCYYCIPLYHGTGGLAAMIDLMGGLSVALAPRFSVSRFWDDCVDSQSTVALYVGEILRYLVSAPPSPNDRKHHIRLVWGNGLRPDIWQRFQERFGVPEVGEFFASTEGMLTLVNHSRNDFSKGAVGHQGWVSRFKSRAAYLSVRIDTLTGDMYRDPQTGFAKRTGLEEGGEILLRVAHRNSWKGYHNAEEATSRKFVSDVFEKGDLFYRTGDALRRSRQGLWYFLDRLGDTYRWKGENVSTTEVAEAIGRHSLVIEPNVYGVKVPNHEGRVGCVALRLHPASANLGEDWKMSIAAHLRASLPRYAVPIFLRNIVTAESRMTGNYKLVKGGLQAEGIDPLLKGTKVASGDHDEFYWLPAGAKVYQEYGLSQWEQLQKGEIIL